VSIARPRRISEIKPLFGNLAQTSHYQVSFGGLQRLLLQHLALRGVDWRFVFEDAGLLCSSASLPGSSLATADIVGDVTGVTEKMAHTRMFTPIDLTFYVDKEYRMIKFLEHWIEFIASGSSSIPIDKGYYFRMKYPLDYKADAVRILKFDRDYANEIEYNFFGLFPTSMYSPTIAYNDSQVLTVTASFSYERYICGSIRSLDVSYLSDSNKQPQNITASNYGDSSNVSDRLPIGNSSSNRLATGRDELIWRNLNQGTGRLDDPRPRGISNTSGNTASRNSGWFSFGDGSAGRVTGVTGTSRNSGANITDGGTAVVSSNNESDES
jgi:hypothetical protein